MPNFNLPYGKKNICVSISDKNFLYYAPPSKIGRPDDEEALQNNAFETPIGSKKLEEMAKPGMKVAILVDDITRPTPRKKLIPHVLRRLKKAGVSDGDIFFAVSLGTHRTLTQDEITEHFGEDIVKKYRLLNIDYKDVGRFVHLGESELGISIDVYKEVAEADFKIAIGNIVPHISAGWGGGAKMIQPGVCGEKTTEGTHYISCVKQRVIDSCCTVDNPCRREIENITAIVGLDFIVNTVLDEERNILGLFCGHFIEAHRKGVELATLVFRPQIPSLADIVIASANPSNIDFWQGCKPFIFAQFGLKKNGVLIYMISGEEGLCGNAPVHEKVIRDYTNKTYDEVLEDLSAGKMDDVIGADVPLFLAELRERTTTICVSDGFTKRDISDLGFIYAKDLDEALLMAFKKMGKDASVGIIPYCGETVVRV